MSNQKRSTVIIVSTVFFSLGLLVSGVTAFPLETEINLIVNSFDLKEPLNSWLVLINKAITQTNQTFPYLAYGTDWLAFAHLLFAILFLGAMKDPVKNKWIYEFGLFSCAAIIPLALIAGNIRQIPIFWRFIDCSFGVIGAIPLFIAYRHILKLKNN